MKPNTELANFQAEIQKELQELANFTPPPSGNVISTKGKLFTMPNGQASPGPIRAIILDWRYMNSYFEGIYDAKNPKPPVCFAINKAPADMAPADKSPKKQSDFCEGCAMDEWGTSATGKGKACKNTCRLAIVAPDATEKTKPLIIGVSPTGMKNWGNYLNRLKSDLGKLPIQVITEIRFNPNESYPTLLFDFAAEIEEDKLNMFMAHRAAAQESLEREPSYDN